MRYLYRAWPDKADIEDLRQEIFVRTYESGRIRRPAETRYFVFTVARNLLADKMRRRRIVAIDFVADLEALSVLSDEIPVDRAMSWREEMTRLEAAVLKLPQKCREVFLLRKIEGLSQNETARQLGVTESTIEKQTAKAMRALAQSFLGNDNFQGWTTPGRLGAHHGRSG
jgi:RNA polymerase sigma-70 factor (ECF subfamily)